jgi:ParB family chromosome partitioning protein
MLTEGAVRASDKRAQFIGVDAYEAAGGMVLRDLFQGDDVGWLQDVALVDRMVAEKLKTESEAIAAEGWKWIETAPEFAYGHNFGLRRLRGEPVALTAEEEATRDAFQTEYNSLSDAYSAADELPGEIDERLSELETALEALENRPIAFDPAEVARAGAFVSIAHDGRLSIERGYVRPEDELPVEPEAEDAEPSALRAAAAQRGGDAIVAADADPETEEDEGLSPISDRLMTELTSHRTLALRQALGERPDVAFSAALHALTLNIFYRYASESCLELDLKSVAFSAQAQGLNDSASAEAIRMRHESWANALPKDPAELWDALQSWDGDSQAGLFAHIVSLSVNAVHEPWNRRPRALAHADRVAQAVALDMAAAGWAPTVDTFLGRVTKARILQAVAEAKGEPAAKRIAHLKKGDMASEAETLLAGTGWLPEPLRTPVAEAVAAAEDDNTASAEESAEVPEIVAAE